MVQVHTLADVVGEDDGNRENPNEYEERQRPPHERRPNCCTMFIKSIGIIPALYALITGLIAICSQFSCLIKFRSMVCTDVIDYPYFTFSVLKVFEKGQVWRILTSHIWNVAIWQWLFSMSNFIPASLVLEKLIGTGYFVLLMFFLIICSCGFQTIFGSLIHFSVLAAGKNPAVSMGYYGTWDTYDETSCEGTQAMGLFLFILYLRVGLSKSIQCCMCRIPTWSMILITYLLTQLITYMVWNALFFNAAAVFLAFIIPVTWIYKLSLRDSVILTFSGKKLGGIRGLMEPSLGSMMIDPHLIDKAMILLDEEKERKRQEDLEKRNRRAKARRLPTDAPPAPIYNEAPKKAASIYNDDEEGVDQWPTQPYSSNTTSNDVSKTYTKPVFLSSTTTPKKTNNTKSTTQKKKDDGWSGKSHRL